MSIQLNKQDRALLVPWIAAADPYVLLERCSTSGTTVPGTNNYKRPCFICRCQRRNFYCQVRSPTFDELIT